MAPYQEKKGLVPTMTKFMVDLVQRLEDAKGLNENTVRNYMRQLYRAHGNKAFNTLNFLTRYKNVEERLEKYKESTRGTYYAMFISVLRMYNSKALLAAAGHWAERLDSVKTHLAEQDNKRSEVQKNNWITWEAVLDKRDDLIEEVRKFDGVPLPLSRDNWVKVLRMFLLSLYTFVQPRRNLDYVEMYFVKSHKGNHMKERNYFELNDYTMIFNNYKTSRKYGTQVVETPEEMDEIVDLYLKYHPLFHHKQARKKAVPMLVTSNGKKLHRSNGITRVLNATFEGKKISSSMLRSIYLTHKYGDTLTEMKADATAMAHSKDIAHKTYIKQDLDEAGSGGGGDESD